MAAWTWFHSIDPFIFHITGNIGLRWYSAAYIMGFFTAYLCICRLINKKITPLSRTEVVDLITWVAFGVILGGRLGYALFYDQSLFVTFDARFPYWEFLKVYHGGLASHGGFIGVITATVWFAKRKGFSPLHCLDLTALGAVGIFFGRLANFINGELFGRVVEGKALLAVQFPQEMLLWVSQKKTGYLRELSSAVADLKKGINPDLWRDWVYQFESTGAYRGQIYSAVHSLIKACENGNKEIIAALQPIISYRHPSQIYQAFLEGLIPFLIVWFLFILCRVETSGSQALKPGKLLKAPANAKPLPGFFLSLKPGMIGCIYVSCYAVMRVVGEWFRAPDAHIGFQALGLTRGQWLSLFMLMGCALYFIWILTLQKKK